jgi:hypothetical protein
MSINKQQIGIGIRRVVGRLLQVELESSFSFNIQGETQVYEMICAVENGNLLDLQPTAFTKSISSFTVELN